MNEPADMIIKVGMFLIPFLLALCIHEYSHGWVASKLGDPTARLMGRLTLNPMAHADIVGTFVLPILALLTGAPFFGWAKPVPVNPSYMKNQRVGMFWVALAGPASNLILAFIGALLFALAVRFFESAHYARSMIQFSNTFVMINLSLAFFNLLPIHPLDGGKIFSIFLPDRINQKLEEWQSIFGVILLILFLSGGLIQILTRPVLGTKEFMLKTALSIFGVTL
jgi:Zn-dependent protease